jgi:hypothetical protein
MTEELYWVEVRDDGTIAQFSSGSEEPRAMFGGVVHPVPWIDPSRSMFVDGEIVDIGARPSMDHWIDPVSRSWAVPGKTDLEFAREKKKAEMKLMRDAIERDGFVYMGHVFDSDQDAFNRMTGAEREASAALAAGQPFEKYWRLKNNGIVLLDAEQVLGMLPQLSRYVTTLHERYNAKKLQIDDALDTMSVEAITWDE